MFKNRQPFFPGKFIFVQIWAKRAQNGLKMGWFFLDFLCKILSLVFPGNNQKLKIILLFILHHQSHICQNFGLQVMGQQIIWVCTARHAQSTQNKKLTYLWNISREKGER